MATAVLINSDPPGSFPGTQHYLLDGVQHVLIEASSTDPEIPAVEAAVDELIKVSSGEILPVHRVIRPTVVFECNDEGIALSLTPIHKFPPGTTHEAALGEMGYGT